MNIIKPTANQISLTSANNVYSSKVVYLSAINAAVVTLASNTGTTIATFTLPANQYIHVEKNPTDTLAANVAVYATASSFRG